MRWAWWLIAAGAALPNGAAEGRQAVAFVGVDVVSRTPRGILRDQTVLIEQGAITTIEPAGAVAVPPGAIVISGDGRYLAPGLIDVHVHLRSTSEPASYLRYGVTTVRAVERGPRARA